MSLINTFSPPIVVKLIDGTDAKFARITMRTLAELASELRSQRLPQRLADIEADTSMDEAAKHFARARARAETISVGDVQNAYTSEPNRIVSLLTLSGRLAETPDEVLELAIETLPPAMQAGLAASLIYQPVLTKEQVAAAPPFVDAAAELAKPDMERREWLLMELEKISYLTPAPGIETGNPTPPASAPPSPEPTPAA